MLSTAAFAQAILIFPASVYAQSTDQQTVSYTQAQAAAGKITYDINCAACHGVNLEGAAVVPNLSGDGFAVKWSEAPINELAIALRQMPPGNTGGLDQQDYEEIAAYILAFNGIEADSNPLAAGVDFESTSLLPAMAGGRRVAITSRISPDAAEVLERLTGRQPGSAPQNLHDVTAMDDATGKSS